MYKNYQKEPKSPEVNHKVHQPMAEYNTRPYLAEQIRHQQQEKKRFPTEKEYESLVTQTFTKMNKVWLEFYSEYAALCGSTFDKFDFPSPLEVVEQFTNLLTRNREPDRPKRTSSPAPITYGEYKRLKYGTDRNFNCNNNQANDDDGWENNESISEIPTKPVNRVESFRSNRGGSRGRGTGYRGSRGRGGFKGERHENNNWNDWNDDEPSGNDENDDKRAQSQDNQANQMNDDDNWDD